MLRLLLPIFYLLCCFINNIHAESLPSAMTFGGNDDPSTVLFDLNACLSNSGAPGSATDYSEFTADISNTSDCANLSVIGDNLYRENPGVNGHSCAPGVDDTYAMCVGINDACDFEAGSDKSVRFDIEVNPTDNMSATLSQLRFFENAPEQFSWINGPSGANNYPTLYGIRILVEGEVVFEQSDIPTEQDWNEEVFTLAGIPAFTVTETTVFNFELLPYCPVGNGANVAAWDLDNIQIISGCDPVEGGDIATNNGQTELNICAGDGIDDIIEVELNNNIGPNSQWVITDDSGIILALPEMPPFNLEGAGAGTCLIWHLSFADGLIGAEVGANANDLEGCFDLSNPITVTREGVAGGILTFEDGSEEIQICAGDGNPDPLNIILSENSGQNMAWVITDTDGNILGLPLEPPFDLDGAGAGTCLIWNLSFADGLEGAEVGVNAAELIGCFDLSNPITVIREEANGGTIELTTGGTETNICAGDGSPDPLDISLTGAIGSNMQWVITDTEANILALPEGPPFDLDGAGAGTCLIWHLSFADGLEGAEVGANAGDLVGCFDLSNPITVIRDEASGGTIALADSTTETQICVGDGIEDPLEISLLDATGQNMTWVITDGGGNILAFPEAPPFDLEGAGAGTCLIWHLSYSDGLEGAEIGANASELAGCFDLSNPITVVREETMGGNLTFEDESTEVEICAGDGIADPLNVALTNNEGENSAWVITDTDGLILGLPMAPPFDLEGAGAGTCLIWHLSFSDGLEGAEMGMNANDLVGCFSLSNPLTVNRIGVDGGNLTLEDGETQITICADDGISDAFDVVLTDELGTNSAYVITEPNGIIVGLPEGPTFDLEGAGPGVCIIWHLSFEDGLEGAEIGMNANNLVGCHDLSNPITVTRLVGDNCDIILCDAEGGVITLADGSEATTICVGDSMPDPLDVILTDNVGMNSQWVITDTDANILGLPMAPPFDLDDAGVGTCLIWHLSFDDGLEGAEIGNNATDLDGCFDLSNAIVVTRVSGDGCSNINCDVEGGNLTLEDGTNEVTICVGDSIPDPLNVTLTDNVGMNSQWVITDATATILALPANPPFDLDEAGTGICLIWHLSYDDGLEGAEIGMSANDLVGCFDLSQPIAVTRITGSDCDNLGCNAEGGNITTMDGLTELEICAGDSISDAFDVILTNESGDLSGWIITDVSGNILGLPEGPPFDLDGAGEGVCLIWHISYSDGITGLTVDSNAFDLEGCFDLSNNITVTRYTGDNCDMIGCDAFGGNLSLSDSTNQVTICAGDGIDDFIDVTLINNTGSNSQWVITDTNLDILDLPTGPPPFNFEGAGVGICLIWHLSFEDGIGGAEVGANAADLTGCFSLSNSISVIRMGVDGGTLTFADSTTTVEICAGDGIPDPLDVSLSGQIGDSTQWVITDEAGNILGLPAAPPFDLEGAGEGVCLIWNISYNDTLIGAEIGMNADDLEGCFSLSNPITVVRNSGDDCDGLQAPIDQINMVLSPNPTSDNLIIAFKELPYPTASAYVYNGQGQIIGRYNGVPGDIITIDVQNYNSGLYFVKVESGNQRKVQKFLKIE